MINKVTSVMKNLVTYWKVPPKGRYMTFKEIVSLSVGAIGHRFVIYCVGMMILSVGNNLIGNTIGIPPTSIYWLYIISVLSNFPLTSLRAKMIDNTRSMKGKYRPYLITMGIPTVILGMIFILAPYDKMSMFWKCAVVLGCNIGFQFFYNFYNDAFSSLIYVLSPNSIERSDVVSIKYVIENISPSIANMFLPIAARLITGQNTLYDIKVYRFLFPPMMLVGLVISLLAYLNTEEKIVQARSHIVQVSFLNALRQVARNKYFWIISMAGWVGFLEGSFHNILGWMYNYQKACSYGQYSLITLITGNASFWPNLVAPFFIRRYGKRNILIVANMLNAIFILFMLPVVRSSGQPGIIWILVIFLFINQFMTSLGNLLNPSIQADIRDYQQYISGERIDGMFSAVGLIGSVISLATSSVLPTIYEKAGLNSTVAASLGYTNIYDVLYNTEYFANIASVLVMASVVGAILNLIPYFFYDLKETDQKGMISVLKIRALFEDYGNNTIKEENLCEVAEIITEVREYGNKTVQKLNRDAIKAAKRTHDKSAIKAAKAQYKANFEANEKIIVAQRVLDELNKFETPQGQASLAIARNIVDAGLHGYLNISLPTRAEVRAMPDTTDAEKETKRYLLTTIANKKIALRALKKHYPEGLVEFDSTVFEKLFAAEDRFEAEYADALKELKKAREEKDSPRAKSIKTEIEAIRKTKKEIDIEIKKATRQNSIYYNAAKPYIDALKLTKQAENYKRLDDILELYHQIKA